MPKSIARSKTRKSVAKRFKITARGKVLRAQSSRRHLLSAKNAKRKRQLGKAARVDNTDVARIKANLPFGQLVAGALRRTAHASTRCPIESARSCGSSNELGVGRALRRWWCVLSWSLPTW